jgi:hypothetical protein
MTPSSQRIAIAEVCGYRKGEAAPFWLATPIGQPFKACGLEDLPDYLSDLNAMHEAVKALDREQRNDYGNWLFNICGTSWLLAVEATAAQRAEAFLRTVGKWDDSK